MATAGSERNESRLASEGGAPLRHIPQLDGLRAFAILLVIIHHYGLSMGIAALAEFAVRLFFVLSGFLITSIILQQKAVNEADGADIAGFLRNFYVRRALRLLPALYLGVAAGLALGVAPLAASWAWHAFWLSNIYFSMQGGFTFPIGHLWTLAVEEQYYLIWPLVALMVPRRHLLTTTVAMIVAAPLFRMTAYLIGFERVSVGILLPSCLDTFGLGSLLAIVRVYRPSLVAGFDRKLAALAAAASAAVLLAIELFRGVAPLLHFLIGDGVRGLLALWMVWRALSGFGGLTGKILETPSMQWIGKTSYCLYIVHQPAYYLTRRFFEARGIDVEPQTLIALMAFLFAVAVSTLSWKLIEKPVNGLKRHFPTPVRAARSVLT